jgi:hypothetical protein
MSSVADETTPNKETPAMATPVNETSGKDDRQDAGTEKRPRRRPRVSAREVAHGAKVGSDAVRDRVASIVSIVATVCAVIVVLGAVLVVLGKGVESGNPVVQFLSDWAAKLSGPFGDMFSYTKDNGKPDVVQNTVLGYGIAAVAWLVGGRIVARVIRP